MLNSTLNKLQLQGMNVLIIITVSAIYSILSLKRDCYWRFWSLWLLFFSFLLFFKSIFRRIHLFMAPYTFAYTNNKLNCIHWIRFISVHSWLVAFFLLYSSSTFLSFHFSQSTWKSTEQWWRWFWFESFI